MKWLAAREAAAAAFAPRLAGLTPIFDGEAAWPLPGGGRLRLRHRTFLAAEHPPEPMASSVRVVVFRRSSVVVVSDRLNDLGHVTPGGRREDGETIEETARREVLEECGWTVGPLKPFGFHHFHHLDEAPPPDFPFPWCDFTQPLFVAEGLSWSRRALLRGDEIETGARLVPISRAAEGLQPGQAAILRAAVQARVAADKRS
ncbi:MAG TPA: NUDIX domain-containing protein [Phenylobacterium sp.]|nr:NUDIX domain-containing protein [Phenylobacterium sp.]